MRGDPIAQVQVNGRVTVELQFRRDIPAEMNGQVQTITNWLEGEVEKAVRDQAEAKIDWSDLTIKFIPESKVVR